MKISIETITDMKYPIEVTSPCSLSALQTWITLFRRKGIRTTTKPYKKTQKHTLWRQITRDEKDEIMAGAWKIRDNSFCKGGVNL